MSLDVVTRRCGKCATDKAQGDFAPSAWKSPKGKRWCRACHRDYYKQRAKDEPGYFAKYMTRRRREITAFISELKAARGCSRCPERDPICLEFHHTDWRTKTMTVAQMAARGWAMTRIKEEMAKCIVICSNCHRKLHRDQGGNRSKRTSILPMRLKQFA